MSATQSTRERASDSGSQAQRWACIMLFDVTVLQTLMNHRLRKRIVFGAIALLLLWGSVPAIAAPTSEEIFCQRLMGDLRAVVAATSDDARMEMLTRLLAQRFGTQEFLAHALWRYWERIDGVHRRHLEDLFPKVLVRHLVRRLAGKSVRDFSRLRLVRIAGDGTSKMATFSANIRGEDLTIDALLVEAQGQIRIADVRVEKAGLRKNYEAMMSRIIDRNGVDGLIDHLEARVQEEDQK